MNPATDRPTTTKGDTQMNTTTTTTTTDGWAEMYDRPEWVAYDAWAARILAGDDAAWDPDTDAA